MKAFRYYPLLVVYVLFFYAVYGLVRVLTKLGLPRRDERSKKVLFLECMGPPSAGYRHRSQGWVNELKDHGVEAESWFVLPYPKQWKLQQTRSGMLRLHMIYMAKRLVQCYKAAAFGTVVVRREVLLYNDYGNLFFEKWLRRVHNNLVLDVDDDIAAAKREPRSVGAFGKFMLEHPQKFKASLQLFDRVAVASEYLKELFLSWDNGLVAEDVTVVPTCVNYHKHRQKVYDEKIEATNTTVIGWVGSAYNLHNLYTVYLALEALSKRHRIKLSVVCNEAPTRDATFDVDFTVWNEANELDNLLKIDIGIMPLTESEVSKGKGGFKLIQYMGLGVVSVATALTINEDIVQDGVNGFLVRQADDWERVLENALTRAQDFSVIGKRASETMRLRYSYEANLPAYIKLLGVFAGKSSLTNRETVG